MNYHRTKMTGQQAPSTADIILRMKHISEFKPYDITQRTILLMRI